MMMSLMVVMVVVDAFGCIIIDNMVLMVVAFGCVDSVLRGGEQVRNCFQVHFKL